jgi:glycosyltransferase involved in cell wall biosynthesis
LQTRDGEDVLVGNDAETFAKTVVRALEDRQLQQKIGQTGRRYVEKYHDWDAITKDLEAIYNSQPRKATLG